MVLSQPLKKQKTFHFGAVGMSMHVMTTIQYGLSTLTEQFIAFRASVRFQNHMGNLHLGQQILFHMTPLIGHQPLMVGRIFFIQHLNNRLLSLGDNPNLFNLQSKVPRGV